MCRFCELSQAAYAVRKTHGLGSPEHRAALAELRPLMELAGVGKAHSPECPSRRPLVVFG